MKTRKQLIDFEHKGNEKHHFKLRPALLSLCMLTFIGGYSQTGQVNLNLKNATVKELFKEIEKQTSYRFSYRDIEINNKGGITISGQGKEVKEVLTNELAKQELSYTVSGNKIIVSTAKKEAVSTKEKKITGKVIDTKGEPVIGATIMEKGTTNGTITDFDGNFTLNVSDNSMIEISYIGYQSLSVKANSNNLMAITLKEDSELLDEVVVVGYGTQKKVNLSGAVSMVNIDKKMTSRPITSTSSALNGLVPGLMVQQSSGMAGNDGATLRIRGLGTVNNSSPLIVVDGIPDVDLNRIDMNDIASISVLKDAASAAAYGSRAANGVVLITTRRGTEGKINVNYSGNFSIGKATNFYEFLDDYPRALLLHNQAATNGNSGTIYKNGTIDEWMAKSMIDPILYPNTDWWDIIFQTPFTHNHNISANGGTENGKYYISIGILDQEGIMINNDYKKYSFRSNVDQKIGGKINVGLNASGQWSINNYPKDDGLLQYGEASSWDLVKSPAGILPKHPQTGEYGGAMAYGEDILANNPLSVYEVNHNKKEIKDFNGQTYIEWLPLYYLKFKADYGLTYSNQFIKSWSMPTILQNFQTGNPGYETVSKSAGIKDYTKENMKTLFNISATFEKEIFKSNNLRLQMIYSEEYWHERYQEGSRNDRFHQDLTEIDGAGLDIQSAKGSSSAEGLRSFMAKLNYDAYGKYMLQALIRWDASSKFSKGHRWGMFPSISAGWRFSEESFFKPLKNIIDNAKLRISYGKVGNNSGVDRYYQKDTYESYPYTFGDNKIAEGYAPYKLIDPNFTWETTTMTNVGFDFDLLNNRLGIELDYYNKYTSNMIRPGEISTLLSGLDAPDRNIGEMRNMGFESTLSWNDKINDLFYHVSINYSFNKNKLIKWNERLGRGEVFCGYPYEMVYTYKSAGLAQSWEQIENAPFQNDYLAPGDILIEDINGDGYISSEDQIAMPGIMRYIPKHDFSINIGAEWKGFDFSALFQGNAGRKNFWIDNFNQVNVFPSKYSFQKHHLDSWTLYNRDSLLPRLTTGSNGGYNQERSTFWLHSCNYLRLKNLQIGYTIPKYILSVIGVQNLRIYLSGENLFTITKWPGLDPEKLPKKGSEQPYPLIKTFSLGINISI